jgi:hypothetical protein
MHNDNYSVLEYDSVAYRKLSLMVDFNMYPVIVIGA